MSRDSRAVAMQVPYDYVARQWCRECRRAAAMCWCDALVPFAVGFELAILTHPKAVSYTHLTLPTSDLV